MPTSAANERDFPTLRPRDATRLYLSRIEQRNEHEGYNGSGNWDLSLSCCISLHHFLCSAAIVYPLNGSSARLSRFHGYLLHLPIKFSLNQLALKRSFPQRPDISSLSIFTFALFQHDCQREYKAGVGRVVASRDWSTWYDILGLEDFKSKPQSLLQLLLVISLSRSLCLYLALDVCYRSLLGLGVAAAEYLELQ